MSDGLFLECCEEVAARYPDIVFEEQLLDKTCLKVRQTSNDLRRTFLAHVLSHGVSRS